YLRLLPSRWAGAYQVWGKENREAALRFVQGSPSDPAAANVELKCFDLSANPYLLAGAVMAVAMSAAGRHAALPDEVSGDPGVRGHPQADQAVRLPASLGAALKALEANDDLRAGAAPGSGPISPGQPMGQASRLRYAVPQFPCGARGRSRGPTAGSSGRSLANCRRSSRLSPGRAIRTSRPGHAVAMSRVASIARRPASGVADDSTRRSAPTFLASRVTSSKGRSTAMWCAIQRSSRRHAAAIRAGSPCRSFGGVATTTVPRGRPGACRA